MSEEKKKKVKVLLKAAVTVFSIAIAVNLTLEQNRIRTELERPISVQPVVIIPATEAAEIPPDIIPQMPDTTDQGHQVKVVTVPLFVGWSMEIKPPAENDRGRRP